MTDKEQLYRLATMRLIADERRQAGLTEADVAARLGWHPSVVTRVELGERDISFMEFMDLAEAIGFDPVHATRRISGLDRSLIL